jgi:FtsP/CotA-like multicopper oxidase with cupredoxin domain
MGIKRTIIPLALLALLSVPFTAGGAVKVQCPGDTNGDAVPDPKIKKKTNPDYDPDVKCMHLTGGDGFVTMADGTVMYTFGFSDVTGVTEDKVMDVGMLNAAFPSPTIAVDEGDKFYLTVTNVGMMMRPDLFDAHSLHWHGFPQASSIFDGVPSASVAMIMGSSLTYFYSVSDPGTYLYHCHVEATEHMQMGMLGNLYVRPKQNQLDDGTVLGTFVHHTGYKYAYNDGDGSTYYDVEYPIQLSMFDEEFHESSIDVQPLPFYLMEDDYPMLNGRGYPDTVNADPLSTMTDRGEKFSQNVSSLVTATAGQKILLRLSNVSITKFNTIATLGIPMKVVGFSASILRSSTGENLYYTTNSVTLGGGESADVILDTTGVSPGTYFLYATTFDDLNNYHEDFGGMMTEIIIQ